VLRQLHWRSVAGATFQIAVLAVLALAFFMRTPQVSGLSMAPHIASGEIVLINTMAYKMREPARGDIIAFHHDGPTSETFIKRVIGLPGDRIEIRRGTVLVNGTALNEPYVQFPDGHTYAAVVVPQGSLYVLGDNRADSEDSRAFGFVPQNQVMGRAVAGIWPATHLGAL
jgi:signal peptidase I